MRFHPSLFNQFLGAGAGAPNPYFVQEEYFTQSITVSPDVQAGDVAILSTIMVSNTGTQTPPAGFETLGYTDANASSWPEILTSYKVLDGSEANQSLALYNSGTSVHGYLWIMRGCRTDRKPVLRSAGVGNPVAMPTGYDYSVDALHPSSIAGGFDLCVAACIGGAFTSGAPTGFTLTGSNDGFTNAFSFGAYELNTNGEPYAHADVLAGGANQSVHLISVPGPRDPAPVGEAWLVTMETTAGLPMPMITNDAQPGDLAILAYAQEGNIGFSVTLPTGWTQLSLEANHFHIYKFLEPSDIGQLAPAPYDYGSNMLLIYRNAGTPVYGGSQYVRVPPTALPGVAQPAGSIDLILADRRGWEGTPNIGGTPNGASPPGYDRYLGFIRNGSGVASIIEAWERKNPGDTYAGGPFSPVTDEYQNQISTISIPYTV